MRLLFDNCTAFGGLERRLTADIMLSVDVALLLLRCLLLGGLAGCRADEDLL